MKIHDSITPDRVAGAVENSQLTLSNPGFCISCGDDVEGVEPDARKYECVGCGERAVYGAEEMLFMMEV